MPLDSLDRRFSLLIRDLAGWECAKCGRSFPEDMRDLLHCSHFWSRGNKAVRFDRDNCDALCFECHTWFGMHPLQYEEWKLARLGEERFAALACRARQVSKIDLAALRSELRCLEASHAA